MSLSPDAPVLSPALIASLSRGEVVVSDVGPTVPGVTAANTPHFLLELARATAGGLLPPGKVVLAVRASGVEATAEALGEALADALWYAWQEVEDAPSGGDAKSRLADVAKDALKEALLTKQQLFCVGDGEFFEECGLVVSREMWRKREIRSHTKHVYQQRKFNLMREESEGYAKLATLLNQQAAGRLTEACTTAVLAEMKALIGYFDLDPNRCFSVVLDAFTSQPSNDAFLGLVPAFSADACAQVLGFHFYRCREDSTVQPPRPAKPAPQGLYVAAAKLVQAGRTSLEAVLSHMAPSDEEMKTAFEEGTKKMIEGISRIGIISLASAADIAAPLAPPGLGLRREHSGALGGTSAAAGGEAGQGPRRSGLTAVALELAATSYAAPLTSLEAANQKLLLLAALLQIGDWEHAQQLMRWLRTLGISDFAIFPAVGRALCELIGRELAPVCAAACSPIASGHGAPSVQLPPRLLELLTVAGQHLYHDITVLTKLVRTLAAILTANNGMHPASKATHEQVLELLTQAVLPAMSLIPGNAGLVYEIWRALEQLPYTDRFCIYADALKEGAKSSPLLTAAAKLAETEVRRILRRVTAPANKKEAKVTMKPLGRMLAKIMHAAPLAVAEQLIRQVMGMPGMVTSIVESLKYLTPMAFDVMSFAVLKQLASPKKKLKDDGVNLEEWYQWLAAFTGLLCKKHGEVEVNALLQYVANQLKSSESLDLLVLKEMVQTMTGHQAVFDVSEGQLDALAGSDTLRAEVITQGEHRSSDKSLQRASARLLAALTQGETAEQRLAMPLLVLLAQQRKLIVLQSQSTHLKLIAELYDKCQEVCTQYAEFLQHALPEADYRALLPSMEELATEYSVEPELIFSFYRPLIRGIAPPAAAAAAVDAAGGAAGEQQEEEGEIGEMSTSPAGAAKGGAEVMEDDGQLEAGEVAASGTLVPPPPPPAPDAAQRWEELEAQVRAMHGASSDATPWRGLSPTLYTTFWALQLYDLEVPTARYEATISQLRTDIRIARGDIETAKRDAERPPMHYGGHGGFGFRGPPPPEMPLAPTVDIEQLGKDIERAQTALDKLPGELKAQQANAAVVERRLQSEKGSWVLDGHAARVVLPREFSQHCILPRMLNSPSDAIYCARFLKKVHTLNVPGFNLLNTLNHVMREFGFLVRVCTAREATNFGIFLNEVLAMVERWRTKDIFAKECANSQCFKVVAASGKAAAGKTTPAPAEQPAEGAAADAKAGGKPAEQAAAAGGLRNVDHREFLNLSHNWQKKLTDEVFSSCLQSGDYMQAKNALLALNRCVKVYPATKLDASKLIDILAPMRDKDPREDLKTLARMYCTGLEMQMRDKTRNMVATREEYAGLPPKKRPARPAVSKGAAGSEGGKPAAAAPAAKEAKGVGKDAAAAKDGGKGKAEAPAAAGAAAEGEKRAGGGKDEGRRTTDSSKGPSLPPGLGGTARGRREEPARPERERREERRRDERGAAPAAHDGPPPGFGSADKLKHAGSSTELRRAAEQPAAAAAAGGSERERRGERGRDERPPRPGARAEEQPRREQPQREQPAAQPAGREREKEREERKSAGLRVDAPAFQPREGTRASTGSTRAAEEAAAGERDTKRQRREEAPAAAAGGSGREREQREREQRAADKPAERGSRERTAVRSSDGKEAAAAPGGRGERPASGERRHGREEAREGAKEREERHHRPASGERQERDSGVGSKRKREDEEPQAKPADRPSSREGKEQAAAETTALREQRERPSGRDAAAEGRAEEGRRPRRREDAAEAEDARAAAKAAAEREAGEQRHLSRDAEAAQPPTKPAQKSSGPAAAAAAGAAEADSGGSSDSDGDRGRRDRKRDKKKRKEKKEKKEKRHKKERSTDKEPSQPPPAEEHDSKRQRREEMPELPARLRGRLGSGGLLGAALKGIVQEGSSARHEERPDDSGRRRRHEAQQEERVVREVREEREDKRRRGGHSRR